MAKSKCNGNEATKAAPPMRALDGHTLEQARELLSDVPEQVTLDPAALLGYDVLSSRAVAEVSARRSQKTAPRRARG